LSLPFDVGRSGDMPDTTAGAAIQRTFEELLTPLLAAAYRAAASLVGDRTEAEDVVQEASLLAWRAFDRFEPGTNFRAWFLRILTNCCYARYRRRGRRPQTVEFDHVPELYLYTMTQQAGVYEDTTNPAAAVLGRMGVDQVLAAIHALPEEYRAVAALYFVEDLTYEEIAAALSCPVGTVRSRLHRGRKLLQKALWDLRASAERAP
jgi:RNA polymerase sigma-70 factor (ECF subfamily)